MFRSNSNSAFKLFLKSKKGYAANYTQGNLHSEICFQLQDINEHLSQLEGRINHQKQVIQSLIEEIGK